MKDRSPSPVAGMAWHVPAEPIPRPDPAVIDQRWSAWSPQIVQTVVINAPRLRTMGVGL